MSSKLLVLLAFKPPAYKLLNKQLNGIIEAIRVTLRWQKGDNQLASSPIQLS